MPSFVKTLSIPSDVKFLARDRRRAAVHEAGHMVVGRSFGFLMNAEIFQVGQPSCYEKSWAGKTYILFKPETSTPVQLRMIAAAGAVAEYSWLKEDFNEIDWTDPDIMSASDWKLAECDPGVPDDTLLEGIDILVDMFAPLSGAKWLELCMSARDLIKCG